MEIILPKDVKYIISVLENNGYEAYAVGGCVRDVFLGRTPDDWDITTDAKPSEVKACFKRTIDTGIEHGTVTVMIEKRGYEVTTYRIDGEYEDSRHPKQVSFTGNLEKDLERRDFTINAMAYNDKYGLVDVFGGLSDLRERKIRCVGRAEDRFEEDALRMLRAVRFSGQLGFDIVCETQNAITKKAENLRKVSAERIRVELTKLLISGDVGRIRALCDTGLMSVFMPEFQDTMRVTQQNKHHVFTVGEHIIRTIEVMNLFFGLKNGKWDDSYIPEDILEYGKRIAAGMSKKEHMMLCVTAMLHDIAKPLVKTVDASGVGHFKNHETVGADMAVEILKRLSFDNYITNKASIIIKYHDYRTEPLLINVRKMISRIGRDNIYYLILMQCADTLAQNPDTIGEKAKRLLMMGECIEEIIRAGSPLSVKDLAIDGNILKKNGISPGPEMGRILKGLLKIVLENPEVNTPDMLLKFAKDM